MGVIITIIIIILGLLNLYFGSFQLQQYQAGKIQTSRRLGLKTLKDTLQKTTDKNEEHKLLKIIKLYKVYLGLWLIEIILIISSIAKAAQT